MQVRFHKALWGFESEPLPSLLDRIANSGYAGFECPLAAVAEGHDLVRESELEFIAMSFPQEVETLRRDLDAAHDLGAVMLNVHAGMGYWPWEKGAAFFAEALRAVEGSPVPVAFETHRGRLLFEPQSTAAYLREFPDLWLTADFSHWTCVCESLLQGQEEEVELAISRTRLIHARIGHEEGPQVTDPRAPEWHAQVDAFMGWWARMGEAAKARGEEVLRIDPEFGPPNYMPTLPFTGQPVADLWEVCQWTRDRLRSALAR